MVTDRSRHTKQEARLRFSHQQVTRDPTAVQ